MSGEPQRMFYPIFDVRYLDLEKLKEEASPPARKEGMPEERDWDAIHRMLIDGAGSCTA